VPNLLNQEVDTMEIIFVVKNNSSHFLCEMDYISIFDRELFNRQESESTYHANIDLKKESYIKYIESSTVDPQEIEDDYNLLTEEEKLISLEYCLPTVLIDLDSESMYDSYPDGYYLNLRRFLPVHWNYYRPNDVLDLVPEALKYWIQWKEYILAQV
jgi:hypothetical protein